MPKVELKYYISEFKSEATEFVNKHINDLVIPAGWTKEQLKNVLINKEAKRLAYNETVIAGLKEFKEFQEVEIHDIGIKYLIENVDNKPVDAVNTLTIKQFNIADNANEKTFVLPLDLLAVLASETTSTQDYKAADSEEFNVLIKMHNKGLLLGDIDNETKTLKDAHIKFFGRPIVLIAANVATIIAYDTTNIGYVVSKILYSVEQDMMLAVDTIVIPFALVPKLQEIYEALVAKLQAKPTESESIDMTIYQYKKQINFLKKEIKKLEKQKEELSKGE